MVDPIPHGLTPLEIKEKSTQIREPKDALYEHATELVAMLCGLESHRIQGQVPCKYCAGIRVVCVFQACSPWEHDGIHRWLGNTACAGLNAISSFFCSSRVKVMYCVTRPLMIGLPIREGIAPVGSDARLRSYRVPVYSA